MKINYDMKLCYVSSMAGSHQCWFTSRELSEVTGDGWNDAPYELNAGLPSGYNTLAFKSVDLYGADFLMTPDTQGRISRSIYSVKQINAGLVPWFKAIYQTFPGSDNIYAGVTLEKFIELATASHASVRVDGEWFTHNNFYWLYDTEVTIGWFQTIEKAKAAAAEHMKKYGDGRKLNWHKMPTHKGVITCDEEYNIQHVTNANFGSQW